MPVMKRLVVGGTTYDTVGEASVTQVLGSGTKIATVSIDGTSTDLYAPAGSTVDPATAAPSMDGTAAVGSSVKYAREDHVHPSDTSKLSGVILNTSSEPYSVPVSSGNATITIGDGLNVSDSNDRITLKAKTGTTSDTVAAGNHTHSGYQATLVSGTNIKTINNESLLGSGNITTPTYTLPTASTSTLGGVKVDGSTITAAADGTISASGGVSMSTASASLTVAGWSNSSQTVNVSGVTASNNVIVAPAPTDTSAWAAAGIICTAQGAGTLTFTCSTVPSAALTANVLILS